MRVLRLLPERSARRAMVILNRGSGHPKIRELGRALQEQGIGGELWIVSGREIHLAATSAAHRDDVDVIIAAGGDGTVSRIAAALQGSTIPLAVLPLGTLNHFARDLGIPIALEEAIATVLHGRRHAVDLGEVNGRTFVNNSSIGLYPHVVRRREAQRNLLGRGKWTALASASVRVLRRLPLIRVRISIQGNTIEQTTPFVFVANNRYHNGLFSLGERSSLNRGELCLYLPQRRDRYGLFVTAARALVGRLNQDRDFVAICARELLVDSARRHVHVALDGEVVSFAPPLQYRVLPGALQVIIPGAAQARGVA